MANIDNTYNKRYPIELLPGYLQTDSLKKVFNATVNHLFQPSSVEFLDGYVGDYPPWYNAAKDFYIPEPTNDRENYQLTPTIISNPLNNTELTNAMFYSDLVNQISFQGGIVNNPDRLFSQEYYSWSPPIDLDMFVNYTNYYWIPNGPDGIQLLDVTDLINDAVDKTSYSYIGKVIYTGDNSSETFSSDSPLVFTSGLKIIPTNDLTQSLNNKQLLVDNVGRQIQFTDVTDSSSVNWDLSGWDTHAWGLPLPTTPLYVTVSRGASNNNQWSNGNRWFHKDVLTLSHSIGLDISLQQAQRPILQFDAEIELFDYGTNNRGIVSLVDTTNVNFLASVVGQESWEIDGIILQDGMRILSTAPQTTGISGLIYKVSGVALKSIQLTVDTFGSVANDGNPTLNDRVTVLFGSLAGLNVLYKHDNWTTNCQQLNGLAPPLFNLYDINGNTLGDPSIYPNSNFQGSKVFSYSIDYSQPVDQYIGIPLEVDQFGDWIFESNLSTDIISYTLNGIRTQYVGYLFAKIAQKSNITYTNNWYKAPQQSRQYIVNKFILTQTTSTFTIDQIPSPQVENTLPTIFVYKNINQNETLLVNGVDYTVNNNIVTLSIPAESGSIITVQSWSSTAPDTITGYYEIPLNLSANPNNLDVTMVSRSQFLQQFQQIIENQTGFSGKSLGNNNYRDSAQERGLGLSILQHRAPLLKLGLFNSIPLGKIDLTYSPTDPVQSIQYAEASYTRFYNRLLRALFDLVSQQGFAASSNVVCDQYNTNLWLSTALQKISIGKTPASPWANTGYGDYPGAYAIIPASEPLYIPATATRLGITPAYQPSVYFDNSFNTPRLTIQTHDGARIVMVDTQGEQLGTILHNQTSTTNPEQLTNPVAAAWLQFELNMFNNLPEHYRDKETILAFDIKAYSPGRWRQSDYTRDEFIQLQRGPFDKWIINNQVDYESNTGYNPLDPFSFNYRSLTDPQGNPIPGHWQGIYRWFYDTDRPHTCPWEMLGFSQEPDWWTSEYGPSPYTSGNISLWSDLASGIIRQGPRAGQYSYWTRPGLLNCIPVDSQGNLLPPVEAGCVIGLPTGWAAKEPWIFGDGAPVESVWINSQYYPFIQAYTGYLMKPAAFIEYTWDSLRTQNIYTSTTNSQWIYQDTNSRRASVQFYINRETPNTLKTGTVVPNESNLTYFASAGLQVWFTEFLLSQNLSITPYIGNIIRGADVKLAHRMSGFINADNLRAVVDSFGHLGFNSQIIPSENISTYLYRSTATGTFFYSGVIVKQVENGWTVSGYDSINQFFMTIPSNTSGPRSSVIVGHQQVVEYQQGLPNATKKVLYDTLFSTYQQVYDFVISYGRWLSSQGWIFNSLDNNTGTVLNWNQSAKEFLLWAQGSWSNGTVIALSPSATSTKLFQPMGLIQYINGVISGTYPVVDRAGVQIQSQHLNIIRDAGSLTIEPTNNQGIFGLRLFTTTLENAIFFDNFTSFGDTIYDPICNLQQQRIKLYCYRANGWNGTLDAPGYIIVQNNVTVNGATISSNTWTLTNNFDKTASDITKYFNIDEPKNYSEILYGGVNVQVNSTTLGSVDDTAVSNLAKHLVGYQPRQYLDNLLLDNSVEFQFYQGFIRQKGSLSTIDALLRCNTIIPTGSTFSYYDEWMIRVGTYGATALNVEMEYILKQADVNYDPQWIRFCGADSNNPYSNVYDIIANDPLWVTPPTVYTSSLFGLRTNYAADNTTDITTAGYAQLGEATFYAVTTNDLLTLYLRQSTTNNPLAAYNTVWQFITNNNEWQMWIIAPAIGQVSYTIQSPSNGQPTTIVTDQAHGLLNGDICVIFGVNGVPEINDTYIINSVTPTTFNIDLSTFSNGTSGTIWVYRPMRFSNIFQRDTSSPPGGYQPNMLVYVDEGGVVSGAWTVYLYTTQGFTQYRQQPLQINPDLLQSSQIFNRKTSELVANLEYFDPVKGRIPGQAQEDLRFITDVDPASYTSGDTSGILFDPNSAWNESRLGETWWDTSQVRYIDYEQGSDEYRIANWGKIAPGTTIVVYEWIQSSIPPTQWEQSITSSSPIYINGILQTPSGFVKTPYNWVETTQYSSQNTPSTVYYFWVGNSEMPPPAPWRKLATQAITQLIQNPSLANEPWYAAVSQNSIIIGNYKKLVSGNLISQRINYTSKVNQANIYSEWELIRDGDPSSPIRTTVWNKLKSSLVTFDGSGNDVPDYSLNIYNKFGTFIRPRQTWFVDRVAASSLFVQTFNNLIASSSTPFVYNPAIIGWLTYFEAEESIPNQYSQFSLSIQGSQSSEVGSSYVIAESTIGLQTLQPIVFADSFGGIVANQVYYVLEILSQTTFTIAILPSGPNIVLTTQQITTTATQTITKWNYQVADFGERDGLIGALNTGDIILVDANSSSRNLWTIWQYQPVSGEIWHLLQIQAYKTSNYWQYVDWYAAGYSSNSKISLTVDTIAQRNAISSPVSGQIVKVNNGGDGNWQWYAYLGTTWTLVAQQSGSIQLLPPVYDWPTYFGGFDGTPYDGAGTQQVFDPTPSFDDNAASEFANIIDGIFYAIFPGPESIELNILFFAMINYVVSEQPQVDWIFKTSNMVFTGFNQDLGQPPLLAVDNTQSILSFINEAKPYHTNIQDYVNGYNITDVSSASVVDFDVPFANLTANTPSSAINPADSSITEDTYLTTYTSWYNNYTPNSLGKNQYYLDPSLVRNLNTKMVFDRIATQDGWSFIGWDVIGWNTESISNDFGALTRIQNYYQPTAGMLPKVVADLMQGVVYKGQILGNLSFQTEPGWSFSGWGGLLGWDANADIINDYLDQIIQGGQIPYYDSAIGNGHQASFPLLKSAQNPNELVVWSDGDLRLYGVDWIVPTYATNAYIIDGGYGYKVNDEIIVLDAGTGIVPVRLRVTAVTNSVIQEVIIIGKGSYTTVYRGPYSTSYPGFSSGTGSNAQIGIDWNCSYIQFNSPPQSSDKPNIFILYAGTTFGPAPDNAYASIYDGYQFVAPTVDENHPEELYTTRTRDCLIMDTTNIQRGGRPLVSEKIYITDGETEQFDIGITPQSDQAVMAYLDQTALVISPTGDAVINYITNRLVLINKPAAGKILYITTIGFGGEPVQANFHRYNFLGDGSTTMFTIPGFIPTTTGVLVNVNGSVVGYTEFNDGIQLIQVPPYNSSITIFVSSVNSFSTVIENEFIITDAGQTTYNIRQSGSTLPTYLSTTVRQNGNILSPPIMETWIGNGYAISFPITQDLTGAISTIVYVNNIPLSGGYTIDNALHTLTFTSPPLLNASITLVVTTNNTVYTIDNTQITFKSGVLSVNDHIIVTTLTEDKTYEIKTEEFPEVQTGTYKLAGYTDDLNTIQVWYNGVIQVPQKDYTIAKVPALIGYDEDSWDGYYWDVEDPHAIVVNLPSNGGSGNIIISYMIGLPQRPQISWRTTTGWDSTLSTVLDPERETALMSNVYTFSNQILVNDITKLTLPKIGQQGMVYINDELISFTNIELAPTISAPNQAYLTGIARNRLGTCGDPLIVYNTIWYNGDGSTVFFAVESATQAINTTVFVDGKIKIQNIDWIVTNNPPNLEAGSYAKFKVAPTVGIKNVQIIALNHLGYDTQLSHIVGSTVVDAGEQVQIPGGYQWIPTPQGLQYSQSDLSKFLLEHSGG